MSREVWTVEWGDGEESCCIGVMPSEAAARELAELHAQATEYRGYAAPRWVQDERHPNPAFIAGNGHSWVLRSWMLPDAFDRESAETRLRQDWAWLYQEQKL